MERETVESLGRATGCQVANNVLGNPMFTMTTHELHVFAEKVVELVACECAGIYSKIDNGNQHLGTEDYLEALQKHFGVEE